MNFTFPAGAIYNGIEYRVLASLNWIELLAHVFLDGPFSALNFIFVYRSAVLHPNLKFILLSQSACIFFRAISRIYLNAVRIMSSNNIATIGFTLLQLLYSQPTYIRNFVVHILVIERILATVYFRWYERWRSCWFNVCWLIVTSMVALFNASAWSIFGLNVSIFVSFITFLTTFVLSIFELIAFAWIWMKNDRIYRQNGFNLSEKYQLSENIRTAKQLLPCIFLHFINILFGTTQSILYYFRIMGPIEVNPFWYDLIGGQLVFTTSTIISFLIELSMIFCHPFLKRDLLQWWQSVRRCHYAPNRIISRDNTVSPDENDCRRQPMLCDIRGNPLMINLGHMSSDAHFRQLTTAWETNDGKQD